MTHDDPLGGRHDLQRSRTDRVLGGVSAGIAERLDLDPLLVHPTTALRSPRRPAEEVVLP